MRLAGVLLLVMAALGGTTPPKLLTFTLGEKPAQIVSRFGAMPNVVRGREYTILQFHDAGSEKQHDCDGGFEWEVYLNGSGAIQSITWNPTKPVSVSDLFPDRQYISSPTTPKTGAFVRHLSKETLVFATANSDDQKSIQQATLMRSVVADRLLPWVTNKGR